MSARMKAATSEREKTRISVREKNSGRRRSNIVKELTFEGEIVGNQSVTLSPTLSKN